MTHTIHKIIIEIECHRADSLTGEDLGKCKRDCLECLKDLTDSILFVVVKSVKRIT